MTKRLADPEAVRLHQRLEDLHGHAPDARRRDAPAPDDLRLERGPLEQLEHQERRAVGAAAEVEHADGVGVGEPLRQLGLALEAEEAVTVEQLRPHDLERHRAAQVELRGAVNGAEAALADDLLEPVTVADDEARRQVVRGGRRHRPPSLPPAARPRPGLTGATRVLPERRRATA
jgi:hypothetical protein